VGVRSGLKSIRRVDPDQNVMFLRLMPDERRTAGVFAQEIDVCFQNALYVPHKIIRGVERERAHLETLEDRVRTVEVSCIRIVVESGESPPVATNVVDAGEAREPVVVLAGSDLEKIVPRAPQCLGIPMNVAGHAAREIEAKNLFVAGASARGFAEDAARATLFACEPE